MDEQELIRGIAHGQSSALQSAIEQFGGYVHAVIRNTIKEVGTPEDYEELICDVFVALWRNAKKLRAHSNLKAWLAVVARNRALRWASTQRLTLGLSDANLAFNELESDWIADWEQSQELCATIAGLNEGDRALIERFYFRDQSVEHISKDTGIASAAIKSRLHRARLRLKELLTEGGYLS
jgi:RNA polymerase sigma-70 factor (ECF subfamily)